MHRILGSLKFNPSQIIMNVYERQLKARRQREKRAFDGSKQRTGGENVLENNGSLYHKVQQIESKLDANNDNNRVENSSVGVKIESKQRSREALKAPRKRETTMHASASLAY